MRPPKKPPSESEMWAYLAKAPRRHRAILESVPGPTDRRRYLHWDEIRHRKPPGDLTPVEWWFALKLHRAVMAHELPFRDTAGKPFRYAAVDPLPETLHLLDLAAGSQAHIPGPILEPALRDRYRVHSLIDEAISSSQLEGAATTREVAREMIRAGRAPRTPSERMIMNNFRTMEHITSIKNERLTQELVLELHRLVTLDTLKDPSAAGRFRRRDESIAVTDSENEIVYVPPADELKERVALMCAFANASEGGEFVHPVIRSMILHFWLAYDHPFIDGNGRTARALFYWSMLSRGYWFSEFVSISEIILKAPAKYGRAFLFTETDDNDITYFLIYHSEIVRRALQSLEEYARGRSARLQLLEDRLAGMATLNDRQRELIAHALEHPGHRYTIKSHQMSHNVVYQTARADLLDLADRGLLLRQKRGRTWQFAPVRDLETKLNLLD